MARKTRAVRIEDMFEARRVLQPAISPDGRTVAYLVIGVDRDADVNTSTIWTAPLDGKGRPRPFTQGPHAARPIWSPDGESLEGIRRDSAACRSFSR